MRPVRAPILVCAALLCLSGCASYDPPIEGDRTAEKYQTDLQDCQTYSRKAVYLKNADNIFSWAISPFTGPPAVRRAIRSCLQAKGYVLQDAAS